MRYIIERIKEGDNLLKNIIKYRTRVRLGKYIQESFDKNRVYWCGQLRLYVCPAVPKSIKLYITRRVVPHYCLSH